MLLQTRHLSAAPVKDFLVDARRILSRAFRFAAAGLLAAHAFDAHAEHYWYDASAPAPQVHYLSATGACHGGAQRIMAAYQAGSPYKHRIEVLSAGAVDSNEYLCSVTIYKKQIMWLPVVVEQPYSVYLTGADCPIAGRGDASGYCGAKQPRNECNGSNPILGAFGAKYQYEQDYAAGQGVPVVLGRHYNHLAGESNAMGAGWRNEYERKLVVDDIDLDSIAYDPTSLTLQRQDGTRYKFTLSGSAWVADPDVKYKVVRLTDAEIGTTGWRVTTPDGHIETYAGTGDLVAINAIGGGVLTLGYDTNRRLNKLTDSFGRIFTVAWDAAAGRINKISTPDIAHSYSYAYDANGNLSAVTYPDGTLNGPQRSYLYNEPANTGNNSYPNFLTGIADENGSRFATYKYDSTKKAIESAHAGGADRFAFAYGGDGSVAITGPQGGVSTFTYATVNGARLIAGRTQPAGAGCAAASSAVAYDANGNAASRTDFKGINTTYTYDLTRNLETSRIEAAGTAQARTISTQWHPDWRLPSKVAEPKKLTVSVYHGQPDPGAGGAIASCAPGSALLPGGKPIAVLCKRTEQATTDATGAAGFAAAVSGAPRTWAWTYNATGQVLTADGPRTDLLDKTTYTYYSDTTTAHTTGDLASISNALGHLTQFTSYDKHGRPLAITDPNGVVSTFSYTPRGWLSTRSVGGQTTTYTYDNLGQLTRVTLADGSYTDYAYDAAHRLTSVTDRLGNAIDTTLDNAGHVTGTHWQNADGSTAKSTTAQHDALGRPQTLTDGLSHATTQTFDANGNPTGRTDPKSQTTTQTWDARNRLTRIVDPASGNTTFAYDALDQLTSVTAPNNASTSFTIDGLGNRTQEVSADRGSTNASYDEAGNLKTRTDARGIVANLTYDALNRPLGVTYPSTGQSIVITWDSAPGCSNGIGRRCKITDTVGSTTYSYDSRGNPVSETRSIGSASFTTQYAYDAADRLSTIITPAGKVISLTRNTGGQIHSVAAPVAGTGLTLAQNIKTNALGLTTAQTLGNGVSETRTYDSAGQAASVIDVAGGSGGGADGDVPTLPEWGAILLGLLLMGLGVRHNRHPGHALPLLVCLTLGLSFLALNNAPAQADETLSYDANGNIVQRVGPTGTTTYGYDPLDRLKNEAGPSKAQTLTYDANGNRLSDASGSHTYSANSDRQVTIAGQTVTLDAAGYITQARGLGFVWNAAGQLKEVRQGSPTGTLLASYDYDGQNRRIRKVTTAAAPQGATTVLYLYDLNDRLLMEADAAGTPKVTYVWRDDIPVSLIVAGSPETALYLETDHLNTPRAARNQNKTVVWRWESDAFGATPASDDPDGDGTNVTINLRFPGQYYDRESGLHYNWHRYYDPQLGRYISSDPIGLAGGINTYSYVEGNPLNDVDPRGLDNPGIGPYGPGPNNGNGSVGLSQTAGAMRDFQRNYQDMRDANTIGGDKYFHCKANCEATRRGPAGEEMACKISDGREWSDMNLKGDPPSASRADQAANAIGRSGALSSSQSCSAVCAGFRPNGLPAQY